MESAWKTLLFSTLPVALVVGLVLAFGDKIIGRPKVHYTIPTDGVFVTHLRKETAYAEKTVSVEFLDRSVLQPGLENGPFTIAPHVISKYNTDLFIVITGVKDFVTFTPTGRRINDILFEYSGQDGITREGSLGFHTKHIITLTGFGFNATLYRKIGS